VKTKAFIILLLLTLTMFSFPVQAKVLISIQALNNDFYVVPGNTIVIPYRLTNLGNETIGNVTVYVAGPTTGFQYGIKVVREPLAPGESYNGTITVTVLNPEPGNYTLKLVAKIGDVYSESLITVIVKPVIDYFPKINVESKYIYGHDVNISLEIVSKSNTIISGRLGYTVTFNGTVIKNVTSVTFVKPGGMWVQNIYLVKPRIGFYTVRLWANMSGVYKETTTTFEVYRRNLHYTVDFKNGAIHVFVYDPHGNGVEGIQVSINGMQFSTGSDGTVTYLVTAPGVYNLVLNLDGKIVKKTITVSQLAIDVTQKGSELLVRVRASEKPVPGIVVTVSGSKGSTYAVTNESGIAVVNLKTTGYGPLIVSAESDRYLGARITFNAVPPQTPTQTFTTSTTTTPPLNTTSSSTSQGGPRGSVALGLLLILSGLILAGTAYLAFFSPVLQEETLDKYYFVKVRAPRMKPLENFRFEKPVTAVEVRATKGTARVEDNRVIWEIDHLEPGEEAYLQVILG